MRTVDARARQYLVSERDGTGTICPIQSVFHPLMMMMMVVGERSIREILWGNENWEDERTHGKDPTVKVTVACYSIGRVRIEPPVSLLSSGMIYHSYLLISVKRRCNNCFKQE